MIGEQQQEARDLTAAREDAGMYADEVKGHYDAAKGKATDARAQANAARAAANKAKAQNVIATEAHTGDTGAGMAYMAAMDAAGKAQSAAYVHVLGLLMHANGTDITTVGDEDDVDVAKALADAREARREMTAAALNTAAGAADNAEAGTTATATWPGVVDDPDTAETDESAGSVLRVMVDPAASGTGLRFTPEAIPDDPDTTGTDESMTKTATAIDGLGDFMHGYSITDDDRHVIVFADKTQDAAPVTEVTPLTMSTHTNLTVDLNDHTITDLGTKSGDTYTGVTFYELGTVPDDTDAGLAFMGSLTCPDGVTCNIQTDADGDVTAITGYQFTGSRAARAAVEAMTAEQQAAANQGYLAFGVWLREDANDDGTADDPDFGAFAAGGSPVADLAVEITGTATYEGSAAGVYTAGETVDWFEGDAELTADFGADDAQGTITGMIDNIVAGGNAMSDVILLNDDGTPDDGNMVAGGTFSGDARMGTATTVDAVTTYTHNGSWSGQFFNGTADVAATTDVDESEVPPGSVAGTFGVTGTVGMGDDAVTRSYVGAFGAHK